MIDHFVGVCSTLNKGTDFHKAWFQRYAFRACCSLPSNFLLRHFRTWTPRINASGPCGQLLRSHLSNHSLFCLSLEVGLFHLFFPWSFQIKAPFLRTEELSPTLCPAHFHFCRFIWAATGLCVAPSPQFLFADKVRPKDVKHISQSTCSIWYSFYLPVLRPFRRTGLTSSKYLLIFYNRQKLHGGRVNFWGGNETSVT